MKNRLLIILFFTLIFAQSGQSQFVIEDERGKRLSDVYYQGPSLIYDCINKHWVCVDKMNFEKCTNERKDMRVKKFLNLPCAPIKEFQTIDECVVEQSRQVDLPKIKDFCLLEKN